MFFCNYNFLFFVTINLNVDFLIIIYGPSTVSKILVLLSTKVHLSQGHTCLIPSTQANGLVIILLI
jgi:RecA-family ATPase